MKLALLKTIQGRNKISCNGLCKEVLLKGKAQYGWPPCTNQFRWAPFYIENVMYLFHKSNYLNEVVNCTKPSPLVRLPWPVHQLLPYFVSYSCKLFVALTSLLWIFVRTTYSHNKISKMVYCMHVHMQWFQNALLYWYVLGLNSKPFEKP